MRSWSAVKIENWDGPRAGQPLVKVTLTLRGIVNRRVQTYTCKILYIYACEGEYVYLFGTNSNIKNLHLRPKAEYLTEFFDDLPEFERNLVNPDSAPKYTATFEIEDEIDNGVMLSYESFTFPIGVGGYNLDVTSSAFNMYLKRLSEIGLKYDERLSDNLYRSMTHEAIKNLDWTNGDSDMAAKYEPGMNKFKKVLRLIGRGFDEVKAYIDGIQQSNAVTYADNDGMTNYALSDALNTRGWDICSIKPYFAQWLDYVTGAKKNQPDFDKNDICDTAVTSNYKVVFNHEDYEYKPYKNETDGYFLCCGNQEYALNGETEKLVTDRYIVYCEKRLFFDCNGDLKICFQNDHGECEDHITVRDDDNTGFVYIDGKSYKIYTTTRLEKAIRSYSDETPWNSNKINYEFLRRLALSSNSILSKKGTIAGIEELLGLFGLVSRRFITKSEYEYSYGRDEDDQLIYVDNYNETYDYVIKEQTLLTQPIRETSNLAKNLMDIDWYNSTKTYKYNSYNAKHGVYDSYRGLPVTYVNYYYQRGTSGAVTDIEHNGVGERRNFAYRLLYPYFDKYAEHDGGMYYQMYGGWLTQGPYTINKEGEILCGDVFTETLRNVYEVTHAIDLVNIPINHLQNDFFVEVEDNSVPFVLINGIPFEVKTESVKYNNSYVKCSFIELAISNVGVLLGHTELHSGTLIVSNPCYSQFQRTVDFSTYDRERVIKIYLYKGTGIKTPFDASVDTGVTPSIILRDPNVDADEPTNPIIFQYISGDDTYSKYWHLADKSYGYKFKMTEANYDNYPDSLYQDGWERIPASDPRAKYLDMIETIKVSNNPHSAKLPYDDGVEYLRRYEVLFKAALDEEAFNETCYENGIVDTESIAAIGFPNIIKYNEVTGLGSIQTLQDDKIHGFCNLVSTGGTKTKYGTDRNTLKYTTRTVLFRGANGLNYGDNDFGIDLADSSIDNIINTKYMELIFNVYTYDVEKYKYIHDVVMKYLEQELPSTIICRVTYDNTAIYEEAIGDYISADNNDLTMEVNRTFIVR